MEKAYEKLSNDAAKFLCERAGEEEGKSLSLSNPWLLKIYFY